MRYFDLIVQSLILVVFAFGVFDGWRQNQDTLIVVYFAQMLLGTWQMLSSMISVLVHAPFYKLKLIHFLVSIGYLLVLGLLVTNKILYDDVLMYMVTIPAWMLAVFYFHITCRWAFARQRKSGKFLPNVFF